jgi:hypothetical protein
VEMLGLYFFLLPFLARSSFLLQTKTDANQHTQNSSNLTFALSPGWSFVETEDWRPDLEAGWGGVGSDDSTFSTPFPFPLPTLPGYKFVLRLNPTRNL